MFRIKRTRWISLAFLLGALLLPLPATAGGFWEGPAGESWAGWWVDLLGWLGLEPAAVETTSPMIDPNGKPPSPATPDSSSSINPLGRPGPGGPRWRFQADSPMIDPNGKPGPAPGSTGQP